VLDLSTINEPIAELITRELEEVVVIFERQLASELSAVNGLCMHIERYRGKMLRPTLVLLSGLAAGGEPCDGSALTQAHRTVSAVVEMIHMATLVHDDVLDNGMTFLLLPRHEEPNTVSCGWVAKVGSVNERPGITGISHFFEHMMCEGELAQLHHRHDYGVDERTYHEIIRRKTASLIAECCRLGARLAGADEPLQRTVHAAGMAMGVAFQIQDDLLDLVGEPNVVGKTLGKDLDKGKLTLPLIVHLSTAGQRDRGRALARIDLADAEGLRAGLLESGAIEHARQAAAGFVAEAKTQLASLPPNAASDLFRSLADRIVARHR
jgi:octaprenyl-diphosphate synthase